VKILGFIIILSFSYHRLKYKRNNILIANSYCWWNPG